MRYVSLDQFFALLLLPVVLFLLGCLYLIVVPLQGRPFFFASERMKTRRQAFSLLKIRTMTPLERSAPVTALGGDQKNRVTPVGRFLRTYRLDELPQIFNVLRGDIRFIGPRPPLRRYVEDFPELYRKVLDRTPPGITGLATVTLHAREERLLARCRTADETDAVYRRRCIPVKARLDLIYRRRRGLGLNLIILWRTFSRLSFPKLPRAQARERTGDVRYALLRPLED
ncbi:MAG: sugar transferase [Silicimonas sp.]|nr:sugar transferase [Silicimonas sp.]